MTRRLALKEAVPLVVALLLAVGSLRAQGPPPRQPDDRDGGRMNGPGGPPPRELGPPPRDRRGLGPMDRAVHVGPPGRWWSDPRLAQLLQLSADQQKAMDAVFEQNRARLMDLNNTLRRQEAALMPLVSADNLDEPKTLLQIDRVAQARADLEKANGRMLIALRKLLVGDQWRRLQADDPSPRSAGPSHHP